MKVLIITKQKIDDYETLKLIDGFTNKNIDASICYFNKFDIVINDGIYYDGAPIELPEVILVRLGAGITRRELSVLRYFELANVQCYNSSASINTVQDKFYSSEILANAGIPVPTALCVRTPSNNSIVADKIGFPCIVKVIVGSFGEGVYICNSEKEYINLVEFVDAISSDKVLIAQEYIGDRPGEDLRVFVVGGEVIGVMKRTARDGDFRANITHGGVGESYPLTKEIEEVALNTANVLGLSIAGIDLLFDSRGFRVCEANSNPGFSGFEKYCGTDISGAIVSFIESKLNTYTKEQ